MRMLTKLAVAIALVLVTGSTAVAVQFVQTSTLALDDAAAVTTETVLDVWIMGNNACSVGSGGPMIEPQCATRVVANYTDALQTMHYFPNAECLDWAEGYHTAIPDDGPGISKVTTDFC